MHWQSNTTRGDDLPQIRFWDHVKYGLVNAQMLKALMHAAALRIGASR